MEKNKNPKATILVSTIIILSATMVTVLSAMFISAISRHAATNSNESLVAYQKADTGIEIALSAIVFGYTSNHPVVPPTYDDTKTITTSTFWSTNGVGDCDSSTGFITKKTGTDTEYVIQLYQRDGPTSKTSTTIVNCSNTAFAFSKITRIKSVGILPGKAQRAISADVPRPENW